LKKAVFLDRDGTFIEDTGYVGEIERVKFLPGVVEAIKLLNTNRFTVIVVTNQAGVARGYFSEEDVEKVNNHIQKSLAGEGAVIDSFYYCPHHVDGVIEEYRGDCYNRKPNPGMLEEAARDFHIDLKRSFIIGDNVTDVEAGHRAGCRGILLAVEGRPAGDTVPDYTAGSIHDAVKWLLDESPEGWIP
jgi:D-glycero-D-manno-heptose 1,7-bisphosphate phosphatase